METISFERKIMSDYESDKTPKTYEIKYSDGSRKTLRTFWSNCGRIGFFGKRMRRRGYSLASFSFNNVVSVTRQDSNGCPFSLFIKHMRDAARILKESGLWQNIREEIEGVLSMGEEVQMKIYDAIKSGDSYTNFYKETFEGGMFSFIKTHQIYYAFCKRKCWKSIAYHPCEREFYNDFVRNIIKEHQNYSKRWTNGYDINLEVRSDEDGRIRGWYSEEYVGCANGHYYLLFDATHAIFYEDD
jgi:hypothetical protein